MKRFDIAIVGSGFSGSLLALIARRLGYSVTLLERLQHPRFMIGESSTPVASLLLEEIGRRYDLPQVQSLAKWGSWQKQHADLACGLKRGFSFYHHKADTPWTPNRAHDNELLVTASPHPAIADTHWYREDFDHYLVNEAQAAGAGYRDQTELTESEFGTEGATLRGTSHGHPFEIQARFVVDATGPRGFLHRTLQLPERTPAHFPPTQTLYTHFRQVRRWGDLFPSNSPPPYPVDDAALHHLFDGGWIWVLRFNNGITSAGVAATTALAEELALKEGAAAWDRVLDRFPSVREQFRDALPILPFRHHPATAFISGQITGKHWAMLPSAAGFIDPMFSTGFPLALFGVARIADALERHWDGPRFAGAIEDYGRLTLHELQTIERFMAAVYAHLRDFEIFTALSMLYFAAATYTETARRLGNPFLAGISFLMNDHPAFGAAFNDCLDLALAPTETFDRAQLLARVGEAVELINVAGLNDPARRNWYPVDAADLLNHVDKLGVTREQASAMLTESGFFAPSAQHSPRV